MNTSENLAFGSGLLNRSAHLREDDLACHDLAKTARILPIWQGKPLIERHKTDQATHSVLSYLSINHPEVTARQDQLLFLGYDETGPLFAVDISSWTPKEDVTIDAGFFDNTSQRLPNSPENQGFQDLRSLLAELSALDGEIAATARGVFEWHRFHGFCANCGAPTHVSQNGWQRDCPACGRQHFPRTDPAVIMLITHGNSVLLSRSVGWPEGMYSLLAGFMEPGETIEAATQREVFEETAVQVGAVKYLASQTWPFPSSLMIGTQAEALTTQITIDPKEIEDARWLTREDVLDVFSGQNPDIFPARKGSIARFLLANWLADR